MKNDISVIVSLGPSVYDSKQLQLYKYATIGVKWNPEDVYNDTSLCHSNETIPDQEEILDNILSQVKTEFTKAMKSIPEDAELDENNKFLSLEDKFGLINLTNQFFEYLKNNDTKIEAIRVSLTDYEADHREQKLKTLKTPMAVFTADEQSMDDMFSSLVKELYYDYGSTVIDIYSIILTPKMYKMINNIPVEYRGLLVRVKK